MRILEVSGMRLLSVDLATARVEPALAGPAAAHAIVRYARLTAEFFANASPDIVLAPLFGPDFDILDLVDALAGFGFSGRLIAVTAPLPRPENVRAEVRAHAGDISFDLLILDREGQPGN